MSMIVSYGSFYCYDIYVFWMVWLKLVVVVQFVDCVVMVDVMLIFVVLIDVDVGEVDGVD